MINLVVHIVEGKEGGGGTAVGSLGRSAAPGSGVAGLAAGSIL